MSNCLKHFARAILVVVAGLLIVHPAGAESTLDKILSAKKLRVAIDVANPPFGVLDKSGQPDGSDVAVARQLAKDLGAEIEFVQVPSTGRIPALLAGRADVTIASISVTTDRAKAVMYCNPNGALSITIFAPQSVHIKTPADLVGKRVGITRATLEEATVPKMAPEGTKIVWFDDLASTVQALAFGSGRRCRHDRICREDGVRREPRQASRKQAAGDDRILWSHRAPERLRIAAVDQHLDIPQYAERDARRDLQEIHRGRPAAAADVLGF